MIIDNIREAVNATLQWCNERRERKNMNPLTVLPKGIRTDPYSCPCGKATGLRVGTNLVNDDPADPLPTLVREFVVLFDEGYLPMYDEEAQ